MLPYYANTHTSTSTSAHQTSLYRDEARQIVRNAVNAAESDAVIFTGSGATGAVHKLINGLRERVKGRVVVCAGIFEHHSNLLPWRELAQKVEMVPENEFGVLDLVVLEEKLKHYSNMEDTTVIGVFSAASNVTGVLSDDLAITALLHSYGALAFWDYAGAAPYVNIDVNPVVPGDVNRICDKDAVYFSAHKFIGGAQTPGVLICKKKLLSSEIPNGAGGGSVFFVNPVDHRYLKDPETREEGGTPAIVESIRAALALQLRQNVGSDFIMETENRLMDKVRRVLQQRAPNLNILGNSDLERLPILR